MAIMKTMGVTSQKISHSSKKSKHERIAEQVQILIDVFDGTLVEGGENEREIE